MATKKTTGAKKSASTTRAAAKPKAQPKARKSTSAKRTEAKSKVPAYLKKEVTEFVVGTDDYRQLVQDHNDLFGTVWNTWRVKPAVFLGMYLGLKKHFGVE